MNKELIVKLIERAKTSAENAYCPYTNIAVGCALLASDNIIFGGCNIENSTLSCSAEAGEVACYKAISEGYNGFRAICFWSQDKLPYPSGKVRQLLSEFNNAINIVVANDETYTMFDLGGMLPFPPEVNIE